MRVAPGWKKEPYPLRGKTHGQNSIPPGENSVRCWPEINTTNYTSLLPLERQRPKVGAITGQNNNNLFLVKQDERGLASSRRELEDEVNTEYDEGTPSFPPMETRCIIPIAPKIRKALVPPRFTYLPKQRQMGKRNPCDDRKRLGYRPRPSFHLAGRQILVFSYPTPWAVSVAGYFPCPGSGKRFRPDGEPRRRDQHPETRCSHMSGIPSPFISRPTDIREWAVSICSRPRKTVQGSGMSRT